MSDDTPSRLDRLESLMSQSGDIVLQTAQIAQQNAEQIARNSEQMSQLQQTMAQLALQAASDRAEFEQHRRTTEAALAKIDRVLDYLIGQKDQ
ncbi:MAG: hypothetical protein AAGA83_25750 [Cyanobacteria bacterium P01_F01_bin.116]